MRVMFVTVSMGFGGVERLLSNLLPELIEGGVEVSLLTNDAGEQDAYRLPPECKRIRTSISTDSSNPVQALLKNLRKLREFRALIKAERPDILVGCMSRTNIRLLMASAGLNIPCIVTEHAFERGVPLIWRALQRATFRQARMVVSVSEALRETFSWLKPDQTCAIYNLIKVDEFDSKPLFVRSEVPRFISLGRFVAEKNLPLMFDAFKIVMHRHPKAELYLLGTGPLESALKQKVALMGMLKNVFFAGYTPHPFSTLKQAHALVLSSHTEGFGNVLAEAMMLGTPVVSVDCPHGPAEIIQTESIGWLVPPSDAQALADAMCQVIEFPDRAELTALNAKKSVEERFSAKAVVSQWLELFNEVRRKPVKNNCSLKELF